MSFRSQFMRDMWPSDDEVRSLASIGFNSDTSWGNDVCPSFADPSGRIMFVDNVDEDMRECGGDRFTLMTSYSGEVLATSDSLCDFVEALT